MIFVKTKKMTVLQKVWLWMGSKLFLYIDVYSPSKKEVIAITFSNSDKYLDKIQKIK